jgi:serine/threonine-protein phosphatase 2A regulatory subunit B
MGGKRGGADAEDVATDYTAKLLHLAWHPESSVIACAASNSLYMYCCT